MQKTHLNFHGMGIEISSALLWVHELIRQDFAYFVKEENDENAFKIEVNDRREWVSEWRALIKCKRSTLFWSFPGTRRICFFNCAWVEYKYRKNRAKISTEDPIYGYEAVFLTILSVAGEKLDEIGLHRLHGFGFSLRDRGGVVLAPSGTGKSTLAIEMLRENSISILSDDTPLVDKLGNLHAFPQRIALREKPDLAEKWLRRFRRFGHGEKYVVQSGYFEKSIVTKVKAHTLWLAHQGEKSRLLSLRGLPLHWALIKWLVIGYETPQIWELYLRFTPRDLFSKSCILLSRLRCAWRLLSNCQFFSLELGKDGVANQILLKSLGGTV